MRQDDIAIFESYQAMQQLNEAGVIRSKLAGMTDWSSLKNKVRSYAAGKAADVAKASGLKNTGMALRKDQINARRQARNASKDAKINKILEIHSGQIKSLASEIVNDLNKLKLNRSGLTPEKVEAHMVSIIKDDLDKQLSTYVKPAPEKPLTSSDIDFSPFDTEGGKPVEAEPDVETPDKKPYTSSDIDFSPADTEGSTNPVDRVDEPDYDNEPEKKPEPEKPKVVKYGTKGKPYNIAINRKVIPFKFDKKDYMWSGINGWTYKGVSVNKALQKDITDDFIKKFPKEVEFK